MIGPDDYAPFFREIWGQDPYPWQERLVHSVLAEGRWPDLLDLPTGAGKTTALDIALFVLAARPDVFPRRIVFVIDRRVVVDQVTQRASDLLGSLTTAQGPHASAVRTALSALSGGSGDVGEPDGPFDVVAMRGGRRRLEWARYPDRPTVLVSTVDQFGSRLLFRGYGISPRMRPVHAGLMGNDCLVLLDEVHLSRRLADTLSALQRRETVRDVPRRAQLVQMSATPFGDVRTRFELHPSDTADAGSPFTKRMRARKSVTLRPVGKANEPPEKAIPTAVTSIIDQLPVELRTIGVMVNRVATARAVAAHLSAHATKVQLITGRMRPADRDEIVDGLQRIADPNRAVSVEAARTVVVATQCLEVGADLSFDALVTEVASVDSLRQRFGRLDRAGRLAESGTTPVGVVLGVASALNGKQSDPVYGEALKATWDALWDLHRDEPFVDSPLESAFPPRLGQAKATTPAPILLRSHLDAWAQTSPEPLVQPDVAPFLHEPDTQADVSVVWRADLGTLAHDRDEWSAVLGWVPPRPAEAMSVPIGAVRRWLQGGRAEAVVADVAVSAEANGDGGGDEMQRDALVIRWRGRQDASVVDAAAIAPGDLLVVPCTYGGISRRNWDPTATDPVTDIGDEAQRLYDVHVARLRPDEVEAMRASLGGEPKLDPSTMSLDEVFDAWFAEQQSDRAAWVPPAGWPTKPTAKLYAVDGELRLILVSGRARSDGEELDGSDEANSFTGRNVTLDAHLSAVGDRAAEFGRRCGLPEPMVSDLRLAGRLHDVGKADSRFQAWLHDDPVAAALAATPLAKSRNSSTSPRARRAARQRAAYPDGMRHELLSVAMARGADVVLSGANDRDLVLHLVATHHGGCRPLPAAVSDPSPRIVVHHVDGIPLRSTSDVAAFGAGLDDADRFWRLIGRYGWHGLAWLEAIFRLADHRCSEDETALSTDPEVAHG